MNRLLTLCLALAAAGAGAAPVTAATACQYRKAVDIPARTTPQLAAAPLDTEVFAACRDDYADVRVLADAGEVPSVVRTAMKQTTRHRQEPVASRAPRLEPTPDGPLHIEVALAPNTPNADGLTFATPLRNFSHQVRVEGSVDGAEWRVLVPEAAIYDYSQYMDVRDTSIALPTNNCRRFRLTVSRPNQELLGALRALRQTRGAAGTVQETETETTIQVRPLRIDRIDFWRTVPGTVVQEPLLRDYPLATVDIGTRNEGRRTVVNVTTNGEPLTELRLAVADRNFSRGVRLEDPDGNVIGSTTIQRVDLPGLQQEHLTVPAPGRRRAFTIVVDNADSPPLTVTGVTARGSIQEVLFIADPEAAYRLAYGWPAARTPSYDLPALLAAAKTNVDRLAAALGPQATNPAYDAAAGKPPLIGRREFLIGALVVMLLVLGFALYHAARHLPKPAPDDE